MVAQGFIMSLPAGVIAPPLFPESFGALGGSTDDTAALRACIAAAYSLGRSVCLSQTYRTDCLALPPQCHIYGNGAPMNTATGVGVGFYLINNASNQSAVLYLDDKDNATVWTHKGVLLEGFGIYGNATNQTNAIGGININHDDASAVSPPLPQHVVTGVRVSYCKGNGITIGKKTSGSFLSDFIVYHCDGYGLHSYGYDYLIEDGDIGQSKLHGLYGVNNTHVGYNNISSWGSGQYSASNDSNNFNFFEPVGMQATNLYSQEASGDGFFIAGGGSVYGNAQIQGISDGDCIIAARYGCRLFKMRGSTIDIIVMVAAPSLAGQPTYGMAITTCEGNIIRLSTPNQNTGGTPYITAPLIWNADSPLNTVSVNANTGAFKTVTYAASVTPDPLAAVTQTITLTGALTIANAAYKNAGLRMAFILKQDATGGRVTSFGTDYKTNWTPDTTANKTNTIGFVSDGTNWWQEFVATGL